MVKQATAVPDTLNSPQPGTNEKKGSKLDLIDGGKIAVIGGGPAGSFFSYFVMQMAQRAGIPIKVDIYERRDFGTYGPAGCNMCGGVISESLIQALSVEGINLPDDVVQRGIDSFVFHTAEETATLHAPNREMRIATVYRGAGPKGTKEPWWRSFDGYLLELATRAGAELIRERVSEVTWRDGKPQIQIKDQPLRIYDLLVAAVGVNTPSLEFLEKLGIGFKAPKTKKTSNMEFELGPDYIGNKLGNAMHAFLLNIPKLDFAAIIPKGNYVTMCLIGDNINTEFIESFVHNPPVASCLAGEQHASTGACRCAPLASLGDAVHPYGDRVVIIGDCGTTRLNKDGIGSAYRAAKVAAVTAIFRGIASADFEKGFWPFCKSVVVDNFYGGLIYGVVGIIKKTPFLTRAVMRMARSEQSKAAEKRLISRVLWDMFTGSAPYRDVFLRCLKPGFWGRLLWYMFVNHKAQSPLYREVGQQESDVKISGLGKEYKAGEIIVRQGEIGDCMYVIQSGTAEVIQIRNGTEVKLAELNPGDIFGEMAIFQKETRSATVRAVTALRLLTIDKRIFLRRVHEDPSFVYSVLQKMSERIRSLDTELVKTKASKESLK